MVKVDIYSGFLGAGKTTLLKKMIKECYANEKVVLVENEFGEIGVDKDFLKGSGIEVKELNSGCICCSLVGDFEENLKQVVQTYAPERILIEPSGVGKLSDVKKAVEAVKNCDLQLNHLVCVVDVNKCKMYMKNFKEFFENQVVHANTIVCSRCDCADETKVQEVVAMLKEHNPHAHFVTTPISQISGEVLRQTMDEKETFEETVIKEETCPHCGHIHEHHHHEGKHEHHHHEHESCTCHHEHDEHDSCDCGHDHHHHHHHHADDVFTSWGMETPKKYTKEKLTQILQSLNQEEYGIILRAKGIVAGDSTWYAFDFVPEQYEIRESEAQATGKLCVIGSALHEENIKALFEVK